MISVIVYFLKNTQPRVKKGRKKSIEDSIDQSMEERIKILKESYETETEMLKKDKQRMHVKLNTLTTKYNKLLDEFEESEEDDEDDTRSKSEINDDSNLDFLKDFDIVPEKAMKYANDLGLNAQALSDPALQPMIMEKLKENKEVALALGIIRPKGIGATVAQNTQPESPQQTLINSLTASNQMA